MKNPSKTIINAWEWVNLLSLDVCAGALAAGIMASRVLGLDPGWAYWVILLLAVWLIYTADHLIDGFRAGSNASHARHRFHRDNARILIGLMSFITVISAFLAFRYLDEYMIIFGLILGTLTLAYLFIVLFIRKKSASFFPKEVLVAFFYTAGIIASLLIVFSDPAAIVFKAALILCIMQACLMVLVFSSKYLRKNDVYRYLSEAVFFLPALMLL